MENIPDSPEGIFLESLLEGMNQYYSEELSQKTKRGLRETRLKGLFPGGKAPIGWDAVNKRLVINEAEVIRDIFRMYVHGKSTLTIAETLNNRCIICKGRIFSQGIIYHILRNHRYIGKCRIGNENYDNIYPAIITQELFDQVQQRLEKNKHGKHICEPYLFRGKAYCGYCGKHLYSHAGQDRYGNIRRYYKCTNPNCIGHKSIPKNELEETVAHAVNKVIGTEEEIELFAQAVYERYRRDAKSEATLQMYETERDNVLKSITAILKAIEMGIVTETTKERLVELEKQKRLLNDSIAIEKANQDVEITKEKIIKRLHDLFNNPTEYMLEMFVSEVIVYKENIKIIFKYSPLSSQDIPPPDKRYSLAKNSDHEDRGSLFICLRYTVKREMYNGFTYKPKTIELFIE